MDGGSWLRTPQRMQHSDACAPYPIAQKTRTKSTDGQFVKSLPRRSWRGSSIAAGYRSSAHPSTPRAHLAHHTAKPCTDIAMAGVHREGLPQRRMTFINDDRVSSTSNDQQSKTLVFGYGENPARRAAWRGFSGRNAYPGWSDTILPAPFRHPPVRAPFASNHRGRHQSRHGHHRRAPPP